ncbi:MAG TPA: hypothetical protein VFE48_19710 [Methylomirabilota bacterium]|nr:hypothetical protein [Methylomirabilota bacterium]
MAIGPVSEQIRGVCACGHMPSMHCRVDGSGPCAEPGCACEGATIEARDGQHRPRDDRAHA